MNTPETRYAALLDLERHLPWSTVDAIVDAWLPGGKEEDKEALERQLRIFFVRRLYGFSLEQLARMMEREVTVARFVGCTADELPSAQTLDVFEVRLKQDGFDEILLTAIEESLTLSSYEDI